MGMTTTSLVRSRWAAIGAAVAVSLGAGGIGIGYAKVSSGERAVYDPINPCRLADLRPGTQVGPRGTPLGPDDTHTLDGWGATGDCNLPSGTAGLALNVTALDATAPTFLRFWPADGAQPTTANLNPTPGQPPTPNAVNVGLSSAGKFKVFNRFGNVNVVIDVVGVYVDHDHDDRYYTESEVDALVASIPEGPQGPQGPPGPAAADYAHLIVVAESGGDFTSVGAAVDAIGVDADYPPASSTERYLIWVAPGVYENEHVVMKPFVDIEGSGQGVTVIRSVRGAGGISPNAATVVGADNSELRKVRVEVEANAPANWSHAIYTATSTRFRDVSAASSGGSRTRGMVVATGGSPILFDVALFASGGSVSNLGLDLFGSTAAADGLFAVASGGTAATGVLVNGASSEVMLENVTTQASDASGENQGFRAISSSVSLEGYRTTVTTPAGSAFGARCSGAGTFLKILDGTVFVANDDGPARGVFGSDCDLELRNMVIDAIGAAAVNGVGQGIDHFQGNTTQTANVSISDVEIRAESSTHDVFGIQLNGNPGSAGTYGHVSDVTIRATSGAPSADAFGVLHRAEGAVQYRGASIAVAGTANWAYGIRTNRGVPRFDDVVIDAEIAAETTVFGVEFNADGSELTNARVRVVNTDTGSSHDAVGVKALNADEVLFSDITASAEAESNVWGVHVNGSSARLMRVDARALTDTGSAFALRCDAVSDAEVDDSSLVATSSSYGVGASLSNCNAKIAGSELHAIAPTGRGLDSYTLAGNYTVDVRHSSLSGSTASVSASGVVVPGPENDTEIHVQLSSLSGGAGSEGGPANVVCLAVTHDAGGPAFLAGPAACP